MRVRLLWPEWDRTCENCATYLHDDDGEITRRMGLPVLRPPGCETPCDRCPKIPVGSPKTREHAIEWTDDTHRTYEHYRECRAVGSFPNDWLVRRDAAIVRDIEDEFERRPLERLLARLGMKG